MKRPRPKTIILIILALLAGGLAAYAALRMELLSAAVEQINAHTPTPIFLLLLVLLPIFGFPMTPFLLVMGIKFGLGPGLALLFLVMPVHMSVSFALARLADKLLKKTLARIGYAIPRVPPDKRLRFSFLVSAIPVAPYAVKNFLLPLAGIPFRLYLSINWPCQGILSIPAVILGSSLATLNLPLLAAAIAAIIIIYMIISRIEKRYSNQVELKKTKEEIHF